MRLLAVDIPLIDLGIGYVLLAIPALLFYYFKTGLTKSFLTAAFRMTVQLFLVGLYLEYVFELDSMWLNLAWAVMMVFVATYTTLQRSGLSIRLFFIPVLLSIVLSIVLTDAYFLGWVIRLDNLIEARYFIPITGMLLGNSMKHNVIALNSYYESLVSNRIFYEFALGNGASRSQALMPFLRQAMSKAFNPMIAVMAVLGLIALPGIMTGQILGGSSPMVAIKYQIMMMITVFVSSVAAVLFCILIANRFLFDDQDNLKERVMR